MRWRSENNELSGVTQRLLAVGVVPGHQQMGQPAPPAAGGQAELGLCDLSPDVLTHLAPALALHELASLAASCSSLRQLVHHNPTLWADLYRRRGPLVWSQWSLRRRHHNESALDWRDAFRWRAQATQQVSAPDPLSPPRANPKRF